MINQESKSMYWIRKFQEKGWDDFRELEVGSIFETSVSNHRQMEDRIGDIIFWYKSDKDKGIYFITEVISTPYPGDNNTGYWIDLKVLKTIIDNPVKPEQYKVLQELMTKINKMGQGGSIYNLIAQDSPEEIYNIIKGNEEIELKQDGVEDIDLEDLKDIELIKQNYINEMDFFNPFVDTNLAKSEVRHLNFVTNLINPNGSHMQGNMFLKVFIDELLAFKHLQKNIHLKNFCDINNIKIQTEYNVGNGRIDMWLENDEFIIAIEGKTETEDHYGQLKKYDTFLQQQNKPYKLFYLTKFADAPKFDAPDSVELIGFHDTILPFVQNILRIENLSEKIHFVVTEYKEALDIYLNELSINWRYQLNIVDEMIKNKDSYQKYENITRNYYRDISTYKNSVVEDVANTFELGKAKIERNFFVLLLENIIDDLEKEGFKLDTAFDEDGLNLAIDLKTISDARIKRLAMWGEDKDLISDSRFDILFKNDISKNEKLYLNLQNHYEGFFVAFFHYKDGEEIDNFKENYTLLLEPNIFYSNNIDVFFDKNYMSKNIQDCKVKILNELKQIEI